MKGSVTDGLLDEARSAETAAALGDAIDKIKERTGAMILERDYLQRNLQDSILTGRDQAKAQAALDAPDRDSNTLESALAAFTRRLDDLRRQETANETAALKAQNQKIAEQLATSIKRNAETIAKAREESQEISELAKTLQRGNDELESRGERIEHRVATIFRVASGDIASTPVGLTEFGRRQDQRYVEIQSDNPSILRRSHNLRRGRFGESNAAKDRVATGMATGVSA